MKNRTNLVWIDLEMTGLEVTQDKILEIAAVVTDKDLQIIAEGPSLVIHQSDEILESMNEWCKKQHALSGLTQEVRNSIISLEEAEQDVYNFVNTYC
jgi:oligoribonuclease